MSIGPGGWGGSAIPSGALPRFAFASGQHFFLSSPSNSSTLALTQGVLRLAPVFCQAGAWQALGMEVTAAGEAGSVFRLAAFTDNGNGYPGSPLLDGLIVAGDAIAVPEAVGAIVIPNDGWYWFGGVAQLCPTTGPTVRVTSAYANPNFPFQTGTGIPGAGTNVAGYSQGAVTGALPAVFPGNAGTAGSAPRLFAKLK